MFTDLLTNIRDFGIQAYDAFSAPGQQMLSLIVEHAPGLAAWLDVGHGDTPVLMIFLLSLFFWFLVAAVVMSLLRLGRYVGRQIGALFLTWHHRTSSAIRGFKTMLLLRLRALRPHSKASDPGAAPHVEFDDLDMAVLRSAQEVGPGLALSAPDLASRFKLRPSQVQRSLEKLCRNHMVANVIGNTDGYENYRLTDSGLSYLAMWQRQLSRT